MTQIHSMFAIAVLIGLTSFGCADRAHLYEKTGIAYRRAFVTQATERDVRPPRGLDAIDANVVMQNYRTMMVHEGKTQGGASAGTAVPGILGVTPGQGSK